MPKIKKTSALKQKQSQKQTINIHIDDKGKRQKKRKASVRPSHSGQQQQHKQPIIVNVSQVVPQKSGSSPYLDGAKFESHKPTHTSEFTSASLPVSDALIPAVKIETSNSVQPTNDVLKTPLDMAEIRRKRREIFDNPIHKKGFNDINTPSALSFEQTGINNTTPFLTPGDEWEDYDYQINDNFQEDNPNVETLRFDNIDGLIEDEIPDKDEFEKDNPYVETSRHHNIHGLEENEVPRENPLVEASRNINNYGLKEGKIPDKYEFKKDNPLVETSRYQNIYGLEDNEIPGRYSLTTSINNSFDELEDKKVQISPATSNFTKIDELRNSQTPLTPNTTTRKVNPSKTLPPLTDSQGTPLSQRGIALLQSSSQPEGRIFKNPRQTNIGKDISHEDILIGNYGITRNGTVRTQPTKYQKHVRENYFGR